MKEQVAVNLGDAHFIPNINNPIYLAAQKEIIRKDLLKRIKDGNFIKLYPLIININLSEKEVEEIFISWYLNGFDFFIETYGLALRTNNLEEINLKDQELTKEEAITR